MTSASKRKRDIQQWGWRLSLAVLVVAVVIYLLIWYGPDVLARHDIGSVAGPLRVLRLQEARDAARGRLLTLGAGLFAAGALVYTARNFTLARQELDLSRQMMELTEHGQRETLQLSEQGQVTDRYMRAIDQLGSKTIDVTIGGIYALERIAVDSLRDHPTVMEVLAACIREHSRKQWPKLSKKPGVELPERTTRPDIQAALTVIGRRNGTRDRQPIDLRGANLTRADLTGATLVGADLTGATLVGADLTGADLNYAKLTGADLTGAKLTKRLFQAILTDATLPGADLNHADLGGGADLTRAKLAGADLTNANLAGAILTGAVLTDAVLTDADLINADFSTVQLTAARTLDNVRLSGSEPVPAGWVRDAGSGRLRRASQES